MTTNNTGVQLLLAPRIAAEMQRETLAWKGRETGGLLLGKFDETGNYLISDWISAGPRAVHHAASFEPDVDYQNHELSRKRGTAPEMLPIAMWHSHPGSFSTPSGTDLVAARSVLTDWGLARPELIVGIAIAPAGQYSLRTFHITAAAPEFREVTWRVDSVAPPPPAIHWSALPAAEPYLAALASSASGCGFQFVNGNGNELHLAATDGQRTAVIQFPADFPFSPAWVRAGSRKLRLPIDSLLAQRVLKRALNRIRSKGAGIRWNCFR